MRSRLPSLHRRPPVRVRPAPAPPSPRLPQAPQRRSSVNQRQQPSPRRSLRQGPTAKPEPAAAETAPRSPASRRRRRPKQRNRRSQLLSHQANVAHSLKRLRSPSLPDPRLRTATPRRVAGLPPSRGRRRRSPCSRGGNRRRDNPDGLRPSPAIPSEALRQAMTGNTAAMTSGFAEINGKVLDLVRAQAEAALDVWRSTLTATSPAEGGERRRGLSGRLTRTQTQRWKDLFETTTRVAGAACKPPQSARRTELEALTVLRSRYRVRPDQGCATTRGGWVFCVRRISFALLEPRSGLRLPGWGDMVTLPAKMQ